MTKRAKRILFYSAVAVFLILSYVVILYAQGYKYSFSENRFFKTGAVYLKTNTSADVFLDDKLLGNTSFFNNSYRLEGLLPGKYMLRVQKNGYSIWQKVATIDEGFVSEFSKILLLPRDEKEFEELNKGVETSIISSVSQPFVIKKGILLTVAEELFDNTPLGLSSGRRQSKPDKIAENVKGFTLSKDKNKLVWWTANEIWVLWLNDANYQPYRKKGDKELITRFSTQIKKVAWFRDEDHLIIEFNPSTDSTGSLRASSGQNGYKVLEIDTRGGINIVET